MKFKLSKKSSRPKLGDIMVMYKNNKVKVQTKNTETTCGFCVKYDKSTATVVLSNQFETELEG